MRIAIEGGEGAGKSTFSNWLKDNLQLMKPQEIIQVSEGVLHGYNKSEVYKLSAQEQATIFAKERAVLNNDIYLKNKNNLVIQDRSIISSLVYQSMTNDLSISDIEKINMDLDPNFSYPGLIIVLDSDPKFNRERLILNDRKLDDQDLKSINFHNQIRDKFAQVLELNIESLKDKDVWISRYKNSTVLWLYNFHNQNKEQILDIIHALIA